jgi:hypothetical protein
MASMLALIPFTPGINEQIPLPLVFLLQHYSYNLSIIPKSDKLFILTLCTSSYPLTMQDFSIN